MNNWHSDDKTYCDNTTPEIKREKKQNKRTEKDPRKGKYIANHPMSSMRIFGDENAAKSLDSITSSIVSKKSSPNANFSSSCDEIAQVERLFRISTAAGFATWVVLVCLVYAIVPDENWERLEGVEKQASLLAFLLLFVSCLSRLLPLLYRTRGKPTSGIIVGAFTVQIIAMSTDFMMAFLPCPIVIDPITGARVHLFRWCEWTPLAFVMTFLTEGVGIPDPKYGFSMGILLAVAQGLSTACGLLFPFCPGPASWWILMMISTVLYLLMFVRLNESRRVFSNTKRGTQVAEIEHYDRVRSSYLLLLTETIVWTTFVVIYAVEAIAPNVSQEGSIWQRSELPMVVECTMDVLAKVIYLLLIVDVHDAVFDDSGRAKRRLEELRNMMSVVWHNSSDVIVISVRGISGGVTTMVSPTYHKLVSQSANNEHDKNNKHDPSQMKDDSILRNALKIEQDAQELETGFFDDLSDIGDSIPVSSSSQHAGDCSTNNTVQSNGKESRKKPRRKSFIVQDIPPTNFDNESHLEKTKILRIKSLVRKAWKSCNTSGPSNDRLIMHDLVRSDGSLLHCEANVNLLEQNAIIVVVRDISERVMRFEAEKQIASESMARKKDAQANLFTRHEVKNGLLASIALCDNLRDFIQKASSVAAGKNSISKSKSSLSSSSSRSESGAGCGGSSSLSLSSHHDAKICVADLSTTLHEVLDTILSEAMARDVIHEVYEPRVERVDITTVLSGSSPGHHKSEGHLVDRFPLTTQPSLLPDFQLDPQLLKYIHRNAITNACKYGKKGGVVRTEVYFNAQKRELKMNVINLPGELHEELIELGDRATEAVFSQGRRLHSRHLENTNENHVLSSGDGAWIMRKCAKTLGGECTIRFEREHTIFTLTCPAMPVPNMRMTQSCLMGGNIIKDDSMFQVPQATWGIAIDDSKIQQKLLGRFLAMVGVSEDRRILLGKNPSHIKTFVEYVVDFVKKHPNDLFLLIVDENLDFMEADSHHVTVSGSLCIENIRSKLMPSEEQNMLALVRSANDSASDVAMYKSRAHGFFPKAPMKREKVMEILVPMWKNRFEGGAGDV